MRHLLVIHDVFDDGSDDAVTMMIIVTVRMKPFVSSVGTHGGGGSGRGGDDAVAAANAAS